MEKTTKIKKEKKKALYQNTKDNENSNNDKTLDEEVHENPQNCFAAPIILKNTPIQEKGLDELVYSKIISQIGEYLKIFFKFQSFFPEFRKENNIKLIDKFIKKYFLYFNLKRFSILNLFVL